ncbi:hypothetical protein [Turicimonas muris]|uniref:Uncharacterized protein n=1 Tax=Turicimonas muris TaxID=1796652 RepID=A0A227KNQ2_9BURK|nr:hypothetical protein [Turicimonas muris]OXE49719.1 hypothetical protein ADH67_06225 [Turicimonas muris]QQQ97221.1 hypothetical protein I5Q81_02440 [Turicimonas muris]
MSYEKMTSEASDYREVAEDMLAAGLTCMQVSQILPVKRRTVIDWGHLKTHGRKENFLERMGLEREAFKPIVVAFIGSGWGYRSLSKFLDLNLWFVRDVARDYRRGTLKGGHDA